MSKRLAKLQVGGRRTVPFKILSAQVDRSVIIKLWRDAVSQSPPPHPRPAQPFTCAGRLTTLIWGSEGIPGVRDGRARSEWLVILVLIETALPLARTQVNARGGREPHVSGPSGSVQQRV